MELMMMMMSTLLWSASPGTEAGGAAAPFFLKPDETVVFFGDSITENGQYVEYIDAFLRTRFPDSYFRIINRGISSETLSGTSEPDHVPPRSNAHDRFTRDVASLNPDVIVSCFGMNDGNYFPPDEERFKAFQHGIRRLIERVRRETHARLVMLTPPPFDAYHRRVLDPDAKVYGYKFSSIDYDRTLQSYADWMMTLDEPGVTVIDLHAAMNDHLARRRRTQVSYGFQRDGIHPDLTGHWLMAQTLLRNWHAPGTAAEARIDAGSVNAEGSGVSELKRDGDALLFTWRSMVPMPMDPEWDAESIALQQVSERLNRHVLKCADLPAGRYRLSVDGHGVASLSADELNTGADLNRLPAWPTVGRAAEVLKAVREKRRREYQRWRASIAGTRPAESSGRDDESEAAELRLRELCQPMELHIRLEPAP